MNTKLKDDLPGVVYSTPFKYDAANYCLQTYRINTGALCVNAAISNLSLYNRQDRTKIRRVANELLRLCNNCERKNL